VAVGYWLLVISYWLLAVGYWLLAVGSSTSLTFLYNFCGYIISLFHSFPTRIIHEVYFRQLRGTKPCSCTFVQQRVCNEEDGKIKPNKHKKLVPQI